MARHGGRPALIDTDAITRAGRNIGLEHLSMNAVAAELGVSATALYRHVANRWELERLVGESLLSGLHLHHDPHHTATQHLLSFALQLRSFTLGHPGLAAYIRTLFPRGETSRSLMTREIQVLVQRGYQPDVSIMIHAAVASIAIGLVAGEEEQRGREAGLVQQQEAAIAVVEADPTLARARTVLPDLAPERYFRAVLAAAIRGLLDVCTPGRAGPDILTELDNASEGL